MRQKNEPEEVQRWTAKRKAAVVLEIIKGKTTTADAARATGQTVAEIEKWVERFMKGGESYLHAHPQELAAVHEAEKKELHAKIGELLLELDVQKKANLIAEQEYREGNS
jgi:transposase-like protein